MQGGEDVFMCLRSRGEGVAIRRYFTDLSHVVPTPKHDEHLTDKQWQLTGDGRLSCRFSRPMKVSYDVLDLGNIWYQLYAWGAVSQCQSSISVSLSLALCTHGSCQVAT